MRLRKSAGFGFTPRPIYRGLLENPRDLGSLSDQSPAVEKICGIRVHSETKLSAQSTVFKGRAMHRLECCLITQELQKSRGRQAL
jgi:hypothetical protein